MEAGMYPILLGNVPTPGDRSNSSGTFQSLAVFASVYILIIDRFPIEHRIRIPVSYIRSKAG